MIHGESCSLDLAMGRCSSYERIERSRRKHLGRGVHDVQRHEGCAISLVEVKAGLVVVGVLVDCVLLWKGRLALRLDECKG
jgi:hypothetical protein